MSGIDGLGFFNARNTTADRSKTNIAPFNFILCQCKGVQKNKEVQYAHDQYLCI
jgi:tRNA 2-selenouridine synthase SelU